MTSPFRNRFVVLVVAVALLAIPVGGIAYAYWSGAATGSGSGQSGDITAVSVSSGAPIASLYPGGQADLVVSVSNPNSSVVHLTSLSLNAVQGTGGFAVDSGHSGCGVAALAFTTQTNAGAGWNVPARVGAVNGTLGITLTGALTLASTAASSCQGATFTVYLAAT
jgi:hypothetical protein